MNEVNKKFGREVYKKRLMLNISQEELAFRCGVHRAYIGVIERGEKSPTLDTIEKIAYGLGVNIKDLFDYE